MKLPDCHAHRAVLDLDPPGPVIINGTGPRDWPDILGLDAVKYKGYVAIHPWKEAGTVERLDQLEELVAVNPTLGIGEMGLDGGPKARDWTEQEYLYKGQRIIAERYHRPVVLHLYRCWSRLWEWGLPRGVPIMAHGFGGSLELARQLVDRGCHISLGPRSFRKGEPWLRGILEVVPLERILVESDFEGIHHQSREVYRDNLLDQYGQLAKLTDESPEKWIERVEQNGSFFTD